MSPWNNRLQIRVGVKPGLNWVYLRIQYIDSQIHTFYAHEQLFGMHFKNFGAIQTKLRNRLGLEKAAKLVSSYRELRGGAELYW